MSGKRGAQSDLNHDNWDREEEPEDRGVFKTASEEELKNRVIKKAKRKGAAEGSSKPGAFSAFAGFGKTPSTASTVSASSSSPFSFLSKAGSSGASISATATSTTSSLASLSPQKLPSSATLASDSIASSASNKNGIEKKPSEYHSKLKSLNLAVTQWIKSHIDENPLVILTPIFKDYEKYLGEIQKNEKEKSGDKQPAEESKGFTFGIAIAETKPTEDVKKIGFLATTSVKPSEEEVSKSGILTISPKKTTDEPKASSFASSIKSKKEDEPIKTTIFGQSSSGGSGVNIFGGSSVSSTFSFGNKSDDKKPSSTSTSAPFSFGLSPSSSGFSFSASKPFTFGGNVAGPEADSTDASKTQAEGDEDQPPKVEFTQVEEKDAIFSKKCKVFIKNEDAFADRGVGTIHLKPVDGKNKTQLIVRADTNLGNILINLVLNETVPTRRMGKNNVMLVAVPMPEDEKPQQILIRVKTGEEADELLEIIDKHKNC